MKYKIWWAILSFMLFISCDEEEKIPEPLGPEFTKFEIKANGKVISQESYDPCEILPSFSTEIVTKDENLVQPSVYFRGGDMSPYFFKFYFKDMDYIGNPSRNRYESLKERIFASQDLFNQPPYRDNFIVFMVHEGQQYSNSWDPEYKQDTDGHYSFIRDRTGLKFDPQTIEEIWYECPQTPDKAGFATLRIKADFEGNVVTEDQIDSLYIEGAIDILFYPKAL